MAQTTLTVRLNETLSDFVAANVDECGTCESDSEYLRDLIRRDMARVEREAFERRRAELTQAYAAPESSYKPLTAADVIGRNRRDRLCGLRRRLNFARSDALGVRLRPHHSISTTFLINLIKPG